MAVTNTPLLLHVCSTMFAPRLLRSLLRSCSLPVGKRVHALIITTGLASRQSSSILNALLHFYAAQADLPSALKLFDRIPHSDTNAADWTVLMSTLSRQKMDQDALFLFSQMVEQGVRMDEVALICFFSACARLQDVEFGIQGHGPVVKMGLSESVKVCNVLMDMYGKCDLVGEARKVFGEMKKRNVVSWTVVLDAVVNREGVGSGRVLFDQMPERNEVAWTIMIVAYVENGLSKEGFSLLCQMIFRAGLPPNTVTLCSVSSACAQSGDAVMGRWVHVYGLKTMGTEMDVMVGTALLNMYAKCGRINDALKVFKFMQDRNVVAWNAMLNGLAMHGQGGAALDLFTKMTEEARPDDLTFIAVLIACSHSGLIDQGWQYFESLQSMYGITPKIEHYACMVDLLGRAGRLEDAEALVKQMAIPPNEVVLGSLLGACSVYSKLQLGERTLHQLIELDPSNVEYHVLVANIYTLARKQDKADSLWQILETKGIRKVPGMSSIHVGGEVHRFSAGDKSHNRSHEIYRMLNDVIQRLRSAGYVAYTAPGVDADELEEEEQVLFSHSEKLAVCYGLLSTKPGTPLYIFKNLRICRDCHAVLKLVSEIYSREIVVRDRNRFHCFKLGSCSCSDHW